MKIARIMMGIGIVLSGYVFAIPKTGDLVMVNDVMVDNDTDYSVRMAVAVKGHSHQVYNFKAHEKQIVQMPDSGKVTLCAYGWAEAYDWMAAESVEKMADRICTWFFIPQYEMESITLKPDYKSVRAFIKAKPIMR